MLSNPPGFPLWEVSSLVFFAIPMAVMVILYGKMGLQIRFRSKHTSVLGKFYRTILILYGEGTICDVFPSFGTDFKFKYDIQSVDGCTLKGHRQTFSETKYF